MSHAWATPSVLTLTAAACLRGQLGLHFLEPVMQVSHYKPLTHQRGKQKQSEINMT